LSNHEIAVAVVVDRDGAAVVYFLCAEHDPAERPNRLPGK
jgi:hypothetical protein